MTIIAAVLVMIPAVTRGPGGTGRQETHLGEVGRSVAIVPVTFAGAMRRIGAVCRTRSMLAAVCPLAITMRTCVLACFAGA